MVTQNAAAGGNITINVLSGKLDVNNVVTATGAGNINDAASFTCVETERARVRIEPDQMSLARQYGADRIWIVNVGHLKGYEFPIEYFMSLAWNARRWTDDNSGEFTRLWAEREFGPASAPAIADIMSKYSMYNGRRKP